MILGNSTITVGGLLLSGRDDVTGLEIVAEDIQGWGSPGSDATQIKKPRQHGAWSGARTLNPRTIAITGYMAAPSGDVMRNGKDMLNAACDINDVPVLVNEAGLTRSVQAYRSDEIIYGDQADTWTNFSLQMTADDPRKYGATTSLSTMLPSTTGGLTYPATWPVVYTGTTATGVIDITNTGNIAAPITFRIDGPVQNPSIEQVVNDEIVGFFSLQYSIGTGNWITIHTEDEIVLENDQSSRAGVIAQRTFMQLQPGDNTFIFGSSVYNSAAMLTVTTNLTWM